MPETAATDEAGRCDLVTVSAREGLEAVHILRLRASVGPVLHDREAGTLGFLVPAGTAERWDLPGSACTRTRFGPLAAAAPPVAGCAWLVPPDAAPARVTEPRWLRAALREASHVLAAVDRCA